MQPTVARIITILLVISWPFVAVSADANWPEWRGPQSDGSVDHGTYPASWTEDSIAWSVALPGKGCSTPIVWDGQIFVTAPIDGRDGVLAYDLHGKLIWQRKFGPESPGKHRNGSGCNPSPVADESGLYVNYKSGTLAALELDGTIRWQTNLIERFGPANLFWDHGSSPVLTRDHVVMVRMHHGESWLAAFDKKTGEIAWKVARNYETPTECDHGYTTPLVIDHQGKQALLVWGGQHLTAHDAGDGTVIWECGGFNPNSTPMWPAIASPVVAGDIAVVAYGRNDRDRPLLFGVRLGGAGDVTSTHHVWDRDDTGTFVPTPAVYQGRVYLVRDRGQVECLDPATGETVWSDSLPAHRDKYYASPLIAAGKLYAIRLDGTVFVADISTDKLKMLSENPLGEAVIASPVAVGGRLLIRGVENLYCIGGGE